MKFLLISLFILSCARDHKPDNDTFNLQGELLERASLYCELSKPHYEENQNIEEAGRCDGILFTALHGTLCDYVSIEQFESKTDDGKLCRDPECRCFYGDYGSATGFSKDMATGAQLFLTLFPQKDLTKRIIAYGEQESWVVCEGKNEIETVSRCLMSPKIVGRWYDILAAAELTSIGYIPMSEGYGAHLQIVSIIIDQMLYGGIRSNQASLIKKQHERIPENGLFHAVYARFIDPKQKQAAAKSLLERFPRDRLPTSEDWCSDYLFQRDMGEDWQPCTDGKTHMGTEFIFAAWALTNDFK